MEELAYPRHFPPAPQVGQPHDQHQPEDQIDLNAAIYDDEEGRSAQD